MNWLNAGALSLVLMMLVGTFHLGAILTGEVGTVARHAANLVVIRLSSEEVELPIYDSPDPDSYKATLGDGSAGEGNQTARQNHCKELGGTYSGGDCRFGLEDKYFSKF